MMSKDDALKTAAKFQLGERHLLAPAAAMPPDYWEGMQGRYPVGALPAHDPVEARLRAEEEKAANVNPRVVVAGTNGKNGAPR